MTSFSFYQIYTFIRIIGYAILLLSWLFDENFPNYVNLIGKIVQISFYRFFEILFFSYFQNRRTKNLKKMATKMGLDFYKKDKSKILPIIEGLDLFNSFNPRTKNFWNDLLEILDIMVWLLLSPDFSREKFQFKNILISQQENQGNFYAIFDVYSSIGRLKLSPSSSLSSDTSSYISKSDSLSKTWQTMIIFASEDLDLPKFLLIANRKSIWRKIFDNICRSFGHQSEQVEDINGIFNPQISDFYKAEKNFCTTAKGYRLICYRTNTVIKPKKIQLFLSTGFKALDLFKATDIFSVTQHLDYTRLQNLLEAGKWEEANQETTSILLEAAGEKMEDSNTSITVILGEKTFVRPVLRKIDALWVKYSKGRFGFSVQKSIWLEIGSKVDYETERQLADEVGWRLNGKWLDYSDLTFSLDAPQGHLPTTELSKLHLGWCYLGKRPLFRVPGTIALVRWIRLQTCSIVSKL